MSNNIVGVINVTEMVKVPEGTVNTNIAKSDKGIVWLGFNPAKVIRDAGTVRTFRGNKSDPKATNTVAKLGARLSSEVTIDGKRYRVMFYVGEVTGDAAPVIDQPVESLL